jgi:nitrogen fixation NifU-like protein
LPSGAAPEQAGRSTAPLHYSAVTIDHFQHPRNVGRLADADGTGRLDDEATETTITLYVKVVAGRVSQATFRTLGCSACIAASSMATSLLVGRDLERQPLTATELDAALDGLPPEKRYCAELVARAAQLALSSALDR